MRLYSVKDRKGVLGGYERIYALAHIGFYPQNPKVAMFLSRMQLSLDQL